MNRASGVTSSQQSARVPCAQANAHPLARRSSLARTVSRFSLALLLAVLSFALSGLAHAQTSIAAIEAPNTKTAVSVAVNPVTNKIYVANANSNNVTVIDGATNSAATATVISDPNANTPNTVAVNPVTNLVYVTNINTPSVSVFTGAVGSTPATFLTAITNGNGVSPSGIAVDSHLNKIYVTDGGAGTVWVIDGSTNTFVGAVAVNQTNPQSIAVNPVTGIVYVADQGSGKVSVINGNLATPTLVNTLTVGTQPTSLAVNPVTNKIYVANNSSSNVSIIDGALANGTGSAIDAASPISTAGVTGEASVAINPVTNQIYVASTGSNNTLIINGANNNTSIATDPNPNTSGSHAVTVDTVTNTVYVANIDSNTVTAINGNGPNALIVDLAAGNSPQAIAVNPVTHKVYVADAVSPAATTIIDGATNAHQVITPTQDSPAAIGINSVTNKIYIVNSGDNDVSVIDGATNTLEANTIGTGNNPVAIAVDPTANQIYVVNNGSDFTTDIDGASAQTASVTDSSAVGSASIAFNPVVNEGFVVNTTSVSLTEFSTVFNSETGVRDSALSFLTAPTLSAVDLSNGDVIVVDPTSSQYSIIDPVTGNSSTLGTGTAGTPSAVAVNSATNFVYIVCANGTLSISLNTLTSQLLTDPNASGPVALAINPVTNMVYVTNGSNNVSVFQGGSGNFFGSYVQTVTDPNAVSPQAIAVNPATNTVYVANVGSTNATVIDGSTNRVIATISTDANPNSLAVDPVTNEAYIVNRSGQDVTEITEEQTSANGIQTTINPLASNTASTATPNFTFTATNTLTSAPLNNLYYQIDTWQGTWTKASGSAGSFTTTLPAQTPGFHIIYAFATDGQEATATITGLQSSPTVGTIASYGFLVAPEIGQFFSLFGTTLNFNNQADGSPSAAQAVTLENEGAAPMTFTFELNGANASDFAITTPAGTNCSQLGGVLPANSQCQFFITFQPSTLTQETATLNVTDDSVSGNPLALPAFTLIGTGVPQLSVTVNGPGSVSDGASFSCSTGTCTTTYADNALVTLTPTANSGSSFTGWSGDCSGTGTCNLTMNQSHTVTATFSSTGQTLSVGEAGTGSGSVSSNPSGILCQPTCSASFTMGQQVTLTAVASGNSAFMGWSGGGCSGTGTCTVTMNSARTVTATFALTGATACPANVTSTWVGGAMSDWNTPTNWSPSGVPNSSTAIVCIAAGASGTHSVALDVNVSVGGLYIDAGNTLSIGDNMTFDVAGTISNSGIITFSQVNDNVVLRIDGPVILTGGGTVTLPKPGGGSVIIDQANSGSLTNVNNTIQGAGEIGNNGLLVTNEAAGVIDANLSANTLLIDVGNPFTNQGLMEATGGGILDVIRIVVNNGANITAGSGSTVEFPSGAQIEGGTITTNSGGTTESAAGNNPELDGATHGTLTIVGTYTLQDNSTTDIAGTINNTGTILFNQGNDNTVIRVDSAVTLTGGGTVTMAKALGGSAIFDQSGNGTLTNVNNLIQGAGEIGNNGLLMTNQAAGVINANLSGSTLTIDVANPVTNQGLLEASNGGILLLERIVVNNGAHITAGPSSTVLFQSGAQIEGGTITNSGGTMESVAGNSPELDGATHGTLTIVGTYTLEDNSTTDIAGTINNTGTLLFNQGNDNTVIRVDSAVTLTGGGTITMAKAAGGSAIFDQSGNGSLTNVNNVIQGAGEIGNNGLLVINEAGGVINSNLSGDTLTIDVANPFTNQGVLEATGGGILQVERVVVNSGSSITSGAGSTVLFPSGAQIEGGTLINSGGTMESVAGTNPELDGATHGTLTIVGTYTLEDNSTTDLAGTINNTGTLLFNQGNDNAVIRVDSAVTLTGGGTVTMAKPMGGSPIFDQSGNGSLTNVNNLIQGAGEIGNNGLLVINEAGGVIDANSNGNTLIIDVANPFTNQGLMEATGGGILDVIRIVVNNGANITAGSGSTVEFPSGAQIEGGTITNAGGTLESVAGTNPELDGVTHGTLTIVGTYTLQDNSTTDLAGTINNTGTLLFNQGNDNAVIRVDSNVTLTGGGTITMAKPLGGSAIFDQSGDGTLTNVNNVIQGAGEIGNNGLVLTNDAAGVINANLSGKTLTIDVGGTFTNAGLLESTGAGALQLNTTVNNSGVIFSGDSAPSTISQSGTYTQDASGGLNVILFGAASNSAYSTNNTASLNGALNLNFASGFTPGPGQSFTVLTATPNNGITGQFSTINSPALPAGFAWSASYSGGQAIITVSTSPNGSQTLTVTDLGTGTGTVTDDLGQIDCIDTAGVITGTCSGSYTMGSVVNLTATPGDSTSFAGWGSACSGTGACSVTMSSGQAVTASFAPTPTSINLTFNPSPTPQTLIAAFDCPSNTNPCADPNAHALALTIPAVSSQFTVTVLATEIPPSQADGICESGNNVTNDFDCRFVSFFPGSAVPTGQLEPLCDPYANGNCVHYNIFSGSAGSEPPVSAYTGPVSWQITWNNEAFVPPTPTYQTTPRLFDDPDYGASETTPYGTSCTSPMLVGITNPVPTSNPELFCQFEFDITTFFNPSEPVDSGIGGTTRQFNDVVVAFPLTIASPNLSVTKTADAATVSVGNPVGFTISVANSTVAGTGTANNVALNDPLPGSAGTNWSISPAYSGPGTCSISGGPPSQALSCTFGNLAPAIGASVHVSSSTSANGSLSNTATVTADNNATVTSSSSITVGSAQFTPVFSNLTPSQTITAGAPSISVGGTISAGANIPPSSEFVSITIDGFTTSAQIGSGGNFSTTFQTSAIPASVTPYPITYSYAGDSNFASATDSSTTLTVNAQPSFTLTITDLGTGSGTVTSDTGGIDCIDTGGVVSGTCSASYVMGTLVNLTETPGNLSEFAGWGGACAGSGTASACPVTINSATSVTAGFTLTQMDLTFAPSATPQTQMATFACPSNPNPTPANPCTDPNAHAVTLTIPAVSSQISVTVQEFLTQGDGICETNNNVGNDFDCRFVSFFPGQTVATGQQEPLCDPYANGSCVHYQVYAAGAPGTEPNPSDYTGPVSWKVTWNNESFTPPTGYQTTPRLFDDPDSPVSDTAAYGTSCTSAMLVGITNPTAIVPNIFCQFEFDITTFFDSTEPVDSGIGGTTRQFNDVVVAFPLTLATPNLTATKTADSATAKVGSDVGFTIAVSNSSAGGTGTANNVALSDPLPGNTGLLWSISPAYTGPGTCSISGETGGQTLSCSFGNLAPAISASVHVSSSTSSSATLQNTATFTADNNATLTASATITVSPNQFTPVFSNLTPSQSIIAGTAQISLAGTISAGSNFPPNTETVSITINGMTTSAPIGANGNFSAVFQTSAIPASATPYTITYNYAGDANFTSATDSSSTLTVSNQQLVQLSVTLMGTGTGSVADNASIACQEANGVVSGTCAGNDPTPVTLVATATAPSTFAGWGGACAGSGTSTSCQITGSGTAMVTANFLPPPATPQVTFNPGTNVMQTVTFACPTNDNPCTSQSAHSLQLMIPQVNSQFTMTVQATEVPPNQANGDCSLGHTVAPGSTFDFDCRFSTFFGFGTAQDGGQSTPLCDPYANGNCVHYLVYFGSPGAEPPTSAYSGDVQWFITWNADTFVPPAGYAAPPRLYDDPDYAVTPQSAVGTDCTQPMVIGTTPQQYSCQFEYDITTLFVPGQTVDSGIGGTTRQFNDVVVAFPPANVPQLTATSAPDASPVPLGSAIGFTVTITNSGSAAANSVVVNDPLPTGSGIVWSLAAPVSTCSVSSGSPQVLSCTSLTINPGTPVVLHVTSPTAGAGTYTNTAAVTLNAQQLLTIAILTVNGATPTFSNLTPSQTITFGMSPISLSGNIAAGSNFPPNTESVSITINGASVSAPIGASGIFSTMFPTATIPASATPYPITYSYAGDANFSSATDSSTTLIVNKANQTISLTGAPQSAVYNSQFTISAGSTSGLTVTVTPSGGCSISGSVVTMTSGTTTCTLTATQAGNGNFNAATPFIVTVSATKAASATTITGTSANPSTPGQSVTVNFKVTGNGTPTGGVTVTATLAGASNVTCSATLSSGTGSCSVTLNTAGAWTLTAVYAGDTNFTGSTSAGFTQTVAAATSTLKFTPSSLNFGTLYVGQTQLALLTLTNTGSGMITFTNFEITPVSGADSNDFFGVSFCPRTLNAGRSCAIIMGFIADSNVTKPHAATLVVFDNAPQSPQTVPMTATVINPIARLSTNNLKFGNQSLNTTSAPQPVKLSNAGTTPLLLSSITMSGNFAFGPGTGCSNGQTLAPGGSCVMNVTFTPTAKGQRSGTIKIVDNAENSPSFILLSGNGK